MAIAFFRIPQLPTRVDLLKNAAPLVVNQSYPIAEENQVSFDNQSGYKGEFLDQFTWQVSEDGAVWSNEAVISIRELVNENTPESANDVLAAAENTTYNIETETLLPINTSVDRIKITGITGFGTPKYNGNPLVIGQEIYWHNFSLFTFETKDGGASPYATISYQCGNHIGYNEATTYVITINVATLARIDFISNNVINDTVDIGTVENRITSIDLSRISQGLIGTQATVNVVINSPMFADSIHNSVILRYNNQVETKTANETFDIFVDIGNDGKADLQIEHVFVDVNGTTTSSQVTAVITAVDGSAANVSATDTYISSANFN